MKFPPPVRFERIVCAFIIHPRTRKILTVRMSADAKPPSKLSRGRERHLPGGNVKHNQTPEVAIRHHLFDKLNVRVGRIYEFKAMVRDGTLKDEAGNPIPGGRVYVTTYWYIVEPLEEGLSNIRVANGCDLVVDSERWVEFHQLIDGNSEDCLGSTAGDRTPYLDLQQVWPYPHTYQSAEIDPKMVSLQQGATTG